MKYKIITISREFGSGGRYIGQLLADKLGFSYYDSEIISEVVEETGFTKEFVTEAGEYSPLKSIFSYGVASRDRGGSSLDDMVYEAQKNIILEIAEKGNCIIVGRCADDILSDRSDCFNVFIHGDIDEKIARVMKYHNVSEKEAKKMIKDTDKKRRLHYGFYTDKKWGSKENYDMLLNSTTIGIEKCVDAIIGVCD